MARKRKEKQELIPTEKFEERYLSTLQNESMIALGKAVFDLRMVGSNFIAGNISPQIMFPIDDAYQAYFDKVIDELLNCHDLSMDREVFRGLLKMMNTKRGFIKEVV